ncbi:MAG: hypothetical protein CMG61_03980 [Candidatus Marinimicrobia bacterium]|nr:hypothetical protein [Candidatus Neomarinimicrobiota bacterium]|tara:strand:- start:78476 stop:79324 length:849 start_codon:yes stop_codon:yes gene_type:complete
MKYFSLKRLILSLVLCIISCKTNPNYNVTGVILDKNLNKRVFKIDHDKIPGFMEPMIMDLNVHEKVDMDNFNILDSVSFNLIMTDDSHYTINFKKVGTRIESDNHEELWQDDLYSPKQIGTKFDNFTFSKTNNEQYSLYGNNKDYTIISFIFSRCPIPNMCPAVISKNQFLAKEFDNRNIDFLILSFDYLFDTPEILKKNYGSIEDKFPNIKFLSSTNHYNDLIQLTKQSNVSFGGVEDNNIGHTMITLILDNNKKLIKSYQGIDWKPSNFKRDLTNFINLN